MTRRYKLRTALIASWLAIVSSSCSNALASPDVKLDPEVKAARELLDSWGGRREVLEQAREKLERVLAHDPKDYFALKELARYQMKSGYYNSKAVEYQGHFYTVGNFAPGTLEKADATVRNAIQLNPRFAEGYVLLGYIQFQQRKLDEAARTLAHAEELGTEDPWLQLNWADVDRARGDYSDANKRAERVLASSTSDNNAIASAYSALIAAYAETGESDKVVALYEAQIRRSPNSAWTRGNFAAYLTDILGRNDEAIGQARAALQIMDYGIGERTLATALYRKWADVVTQGNAKDAEQYFKEASEIWPSLESVMAYGGSTPAGKRLAKALVKEKGVSINGRAEDGSTALLIATNRNRTEVARRLLDLHANPNLSDWNGWTPLLSAADEGNAELVDMLLAHGADIGAELNGLNAAALAAQKGHIELAAALRKRAANRKRE